jgi:hypothetical protein
MSVRQLLKQFIATAGFYICLASAPAGLSADDELTECSGNFTRADDGAGPIVEISILLSSRPDIAEVPINDLSKLDQWMSSVQAQAGSSHSNRDISIEINRTQLEGKAFGLDQSLSTTKAVIRALDGFSWEPETCEPGTPDLNSGRVKLHWTAEVIKGEFSATLIICETEGAKELGTVSGSFSCAAPILGDPKFKKEISTSETIRYAWEAMVWAGDKSMASMAGVNRSSPTLPDVPIENNPDPDDPSSISQCDCSCAVVGTYASGSLCHQYCSALSAPVSLAARCAEPSPASGGQSEQSEVERYRAALEELGLPELTINSSMDLFNSGNKMIRDMLWQDVERQRKRKNE